MGPKNPSALVRPVPTGALPTWAPVSGSTSQASTVVLPTGWLTWNSCTRPASFTWSGGSATPFVVLGARQSKNSYCRANDSGDTVDATWVWVPPPSAGRLNSLMARHGRPVPPQVRPSTRTYLSILLACDET